MTTRQTRNRTKWVTRRKGWLFLEVGDIVNACVKCMGLKPGEKVERICQIRITGVRRERLSAMLKEPYGSREATAEGFPGKSGKWFVRHFLNNMGGSSGQWVTRIEYEYL